MKGIQKTAGLVLLVIISAASYQCNKNSYLDKLPGSRLQVIDSIKSLREILDNDVLMNTTPILNESSADDYYLTKNIWDIINAKERNAYIWAEDIFGKSENDNDWLLPYQQILNSNIVMEELAQFSIPAADTALVHSIYGDALFKRAYAHYAIAGIFSLPYDSTVAATALGIPLRLQSDVLAVSVRSTMKETYERILLDLKTARNYVPAQADPVNRNRASLPAVMAMLSRVYLSMQRYPEAGLYADSCLQLYNQLVNFNGISQTNPYAFDRFHPEVLYQSRIHNTTDLLLGFALGRCIVDTMLYTSYAVNDLRKQVLFSVNGNGQAFKKNNYSGTIFPFTGLATDELYLTRAECRARAGTMDAALSDLNTLLEKRWVQGTFVPFTAQTAAEALQLILAERRKELVFRGLRWADLRRLNKESIYAITMKRVLDGQEYYLPPNDPRYALPIPPDVIKRTGMQQNQR